MPRALLVHTSDKYDNL